jgi:formate dehydrogenase major subunit
MKFASVAPGLFWVQTPGKADEPSIGQLCKEGRFGHRYLSSADRLAKPLVRVGGEMKEATWEEALIRAAKVLRENPEGTKSAVIGNGFLTIEEAYILQDIARGCLDTHHVASGSQLLERADETALDGLVGLTASTVPLSTIDTADLIITLGTDLRSAAPVMDFRVHRAIEHGARRLHIGPPLGHPRSARVLSLETESSVTALVALIRRLALDGAIDRGFLRERCSGADRLEYHLKDLSERQLLDQAGLRANDVQEAVKMIRAGSGGVVALCELSESRREDVRALAVLLLSLGKLGVADSGLLFVRRAANEQGLPFVGLHPSFLPGRIPTTDSSVQQMRADLIDGGIASALVIGEDLQETEGGGIFLEKVQKLVVLDMFMTKTAKSADVVLPISAPVETEGRFVSLERRIRQMRPLGTAPGGKAAWEVLSLLREHLGGRRHGGVFEDLARELDTVCSLHEAVEVDEAHSPIPLFLDRFNTDSGTASVADEGLGSGTAKGQDHPAASTIARYLAERLP